MIIDSVQSGVFGWALMVSTLFVTVALLAAVYRLLAGPTLADRVVALDLVSGLLVVFLVIFKLVSGVGAYIYVGIGLALIAFLGTVAFARYIELTTEDSGD